MTVSATLEPGADAPSNSSISSLDRQIVLLSISLWLLHFIFMVSRDLPVGPFGDIGSTLARAITAVAGVILSCLLYAVLRRRPACSMQRRFLEAVAGAMPACALLAFINEYAFSQLSGYYQAHPEMFLNLNEYIFTFSFFFWIFLTWAALYTSLSSVEQMRSQERQVTDSARTAAVAQLKALTLQVHPHFLFNTLNALSGLIALRRHDDAERMVLDLCAFLRHTLTTPSEDFARLADEIAAQKTYLDIERVRFGERLIVECDIADDCADALIPPLLLHPLIENTMTHCLARCSGAVTLSLGARREGANLLVWVGDQTREPNDTHEPRSGFGIGLANVRERLSVLFGAEASLRAQRTQTGWLNEIQIPWIAP